jgi:hypothetical protein
MAVHFARAPVPCVMAHRGKKVSLLNGRIRTCAGEQEYIAGAIPIWTRAQPIHSLFKADEIGPWMRPQVVADGHQLLAVEYLIRFRVPVSGNRLTRKNQIYRSLQPWDRDCRCDSPRRKP